MSQPELKSYITIFVRAKKDRDAMMHVVERYYSSWQPMIVVETFHGARQEEQMIHEIENYMSSNKHVYVLVLLGREDVKNLAKLKKLEKLFPNLSIGQIRTSHVRNMRPLEIAVNIEKLKASYRLRIVWSDVTSCYVLGEGRVRDELKIDITPHPLYDLYLVVGSRHAEEFSKYLNLKLPPKFLVLKRVHDEHDVILRGKRVCELVIPENSEPYLRRYYRKVSEIEQLAEKQMLNIIDGVQASAAYLMKHVEIAVKLIREVYVQYDPDRVIVPWSGGKDSTAALILALKALPKDVVTPVFVDTGLEHRLTYLYIEYVSKLLGIDPEVEHAGIDREIDRRELPTHENRWCTKLKISALYRAIKRISDKPLIIVGDRDNESLLRLKRPPVRKHEQYLQVAPLKLWSTLMVQYFLFMERIPLNPLYQLGFYRIGCYICPAYRVWELNIAERILREEHELNFQDLLREQAYLVYQLSQF